MQKPITAPPKLIEDAVGFSLLSEKYKMKPIGKYKPNKNQPIPLP